MANSKFVKCSKHKKKEIFQSTLGGLGLLGVVTTIKLKLKRKSENYSTTNYICNNYKELIKENISLFIKLFIFLLLEGLTIVFSILSLVPIADFFADNTLSNVSSITKLFISIYNYF